MKNSPKGLKSNYEIISKVVGKDESSRFKLKNKKMKIWQVLSTNRIQIYPNPHNRKYIYPNEFVVEVEADSLDKVLLCLSIRYDLLVLKLIKKIPKRKKGIIAHCSRTKDITFSQVRGTKKFRGQWQMTLTLLLDSDQ